MSNNTEYTKHAIVYIDILGTRNTIINDKNGDSISKMKEAILEAQCYCNVDVSESFPHSKPKYKVFSDNIVFAIDLEKDDNELFLLGVVANVVEKIATKCGWICRGAFTYGNLYIDDSFVLGSGLVKGYELESCLAVFPRIIINPEDVEQLFTRLQHKTDLILKKDIDGIYYLDYISYISSRNDKLNIIQKHKELCSNIKNENKHNNKVVQKADWLLSYINIVEGNL